MIAPSQHNHRIASFFVFIIPLIIYIFTLSPYVLPEDDGGFILSSYFNGVAHPPGYPLYTLIGYLFSHIPVSTVAARIHFVSAFFGALTVLFIYRISFLLVGSVLSALSAALFFAFSVEFWSQSVIGEVYALNTAIFFAILYLLLSVFLSKPSVAFDGTCKKYICLAAFLYGLGLANHWPLLVLSSAGLLILILPYWMSVLRQLPLLALCICLGLLPYVWMYVWGSNNDDVIAFGAVRNMSELAYYIFRKGYANVDYSQTSGVYDKLQFLLFFLQECCRQFSIGGVLSAVLGLIILFRQNIVIAISLLVFFLGNTAVLILLLGFDFDGFHKIIFMPYPLVAYGVIAILLAVSFEKMLLLSKQSLMKRAVSFFLLALPILFLFKNYHECDNSKNAWAENFATLVLESLPANAILFVNGDVDTGSFGYVHFIQKIRPDVSLYQENGMLYSNRLLHPYRDKDNKKQILESFLVNNIRPIFSTSRMDVALPQTHLGVLYAINTREDFPALATLNKVVFPQLLIESHVADWNQLHQLQLLDGFTKFYQHTGELSLLQGSQLSQLTAHVELQVAYLDWLLANTGQSSPSFYDTILAAIEQGSNEYLFKSTKATFLYNKAMIIISVKNTPEDAIPLLEEAVKLDPQPANRAIKVLFDWYVIHKEYQKIDALSSLTGIYFEYPKGG